MRSSNYRPVESRYEVLKKIINHILFGKTAKPKFSKNNYEIELYSELLYLNESLLNLDSEIIKTKLILYYENCIEDFSNKLSHNDYSDLMNCYGNSTYRVVLNISDMLNLKEKKYFNPHEKDFEIFSKMIFQKKLSEEILGYLQVQFFDFFKYIPYDIGKININEYQFLVDRYVCEYHYDKVVNILYENFNEID